MAVHRTNIHDGAAAAVALHESTRALHEQKRRTCVEGHHCDTTRAPTTAQAPRLFLCDTPDSAREKSIRQWDRRGEERTGIKELGTRVVPVSARSASGTIDEAVHAVEGCLMLCNHSLALCRLCKVGTYENSLASGRHERLLHSKTLRLVDVGDRDARSTFCRKLTCNALTDALRAASHNVETSLQPRCCTAERSRCIQRAHESSTT